MPKTKYFVIDPAGVEHTRNSDRIYTHTVLMRGGYEYALANASDKAWDKTEARNFNYYTALANGTHEHAQYTPFTGYHPSFTAEKIAEIEERKQQEIAKRIVDAAERIKGFASAAEWCEAQRAKMIASVEESKAEGKYDRWFNVSWNGRLDLAQKEASKAQRHPSYEVIILPAQVK